MKLTDLVEDIDQIDDDLIIFIKDLNDVNSEVILSLAEGRIGGPEIINGVSYHYLLEISIAKEIIDDYSKYRGGSSNEIERAKEIYEYAINDA